MPKIKDTTIIIRGGKITDDSFGDKTDHDITTGGKVQSLSVQISLTEGNIRDDYDKIREMAKYLKGNTFTVVYAKQILKIDKAVLKFERDPKSPDNIYHGIIGGGCDVNDVIAVLRQGTVYTKQQVGL